MKRTGLRMRLQRLSSHLIPWVRISLHLWVVAFLMVGAARAQERLHSSASHEYVRLETDVVAAPHFIAVPGRRALVQGYSTGGLEVWAYPFQILRGYQISFRHIDATSAADGQSILKRIAYEPNAVTLVYIGLDFIVRERLVVPEDKPGAIIRYSVESKRPLEIIVHAVPVFNLMWPGALGGQSIEWNQSAKLFLLSEPLHDYSAIVGSPEIAAHDEIANQTTQSVEAGQLAFTLRPDAAGRASVYIALNPAHAADRGGVLRELIDTKDEIEAGALGRLDEFRGNTLLIHTPDEEVNEAIAWSEIALEQAWVCNHDLGCGFIAGYGPTRPERRPQYDWFFAGDGLIAADASLTDGDIRHARDELEFILHYQDKKTGMIWHELSQSAGMIDWAGKYPYMFVHVDVTFQFLDVVARYVRSTGDVDFARAHWDELVAAYHYCRDLIDPATGLPRIPAGKEGGNEQDRMSDDLGLSTSWVAAAEAMADLASLTRHKDIADEAAKAAGDARHAIPAHYWDAQHRFWVSGHNPAGSPMLERRSGPSRAIDLHVFSADQREAVLDRLASSSFETDWGVRSIEAGSPGYDPESYAKGSVWPVASAELADTFWAEHRPVAALSLWRALIPLTSIGSPGHIPEVLAGDFFHPQTESVPEQTWSSAGFVMATIRGLLGLQFDGINNRLRFAPRLPADWNDLTVEHIRVAGGWAAFSVHRDPGQMSVKIQNNGEPFEAEFAPELPLGAKVMGARYNGKPVPSQPDNGPSESAARVVVNVPHGNGVLDLSFAGGIEIIPETTRPRLGDSSSNIHVVSARLSGAHFAIDADVPSAHESHFVLQTSWKLLQATGAALAQISPDRAELTFSPEPSASEPYRRVHVEIQVSP